MHTSVSRALVQKKRNIQRGQKAIGHYLEAHRVKVLTNQSFNDIFKNRDYSGRIGKWAMELSEHIVDFEKRSAIKSQVLEDFMADWTEPSSYTEGVVMDTPWQVHCDRA
jgi:ribosomal protein L21E